MRVKLSSTFDTIVLPSTREVMVREFRGKTYVAIKQIVDALDLSWESQRKSIKRRFDGARCLPFKDKHGRGKWMLALPTSDVADWALKVDTDRGGSTLSADLMLDFLLYLDDLAEEETVELIQSARATRLGEKYRSFPLTAAETRFVESARAFAKPLNGLIAFLGYGFVAEGAKRELDRRLSVTASFVEAAA